MNILTVSARKIGEDTGRKREVVFQDFPPGVEGNVSHKREGVCQLSAISSCYLLYIRLH